MTVEQYKEWLKELPNDVKTYMLILIAKEIVMQKINDLGASQYIDPTFIEKVLSIPREFELQDMDEEDDAP